MDLSVNVNSTPTLQDFKQWKTQNLKDYLKKRGYPCSKRREASTQLHVTTVLSVYELQQMKSAQFCTCL